MAYPYFGFTTGMRGFGPLIRKFRKNGGSGVATTPEIESIVPGWHFRCRGYQFSEFEGNALPGAWTGTTVQTGGAPTAAQDTSVPNGVVKLLLAATNEVESARLTYNDKGAYFGSKRPLVDMFVKVGVLPGANERMRWGIASNNNATLNSITRCLWFGLEANGSLFVEGTDGTNTFRTVALKEARVLVAGAWNRFQIDVQNPADVAFFVEGARVNKPGTVNVPLLASDTTLLQPFMIVQKDSGVGVPTLSIDYFYHEWDRD